MDRAGQAYWDETWERDRLPPAVDPTRPELGNFVTRAFHELFDRTFPADRQGRRLLEVGCARSRWLPYFALHHGFDVSGLDYSPGGCAQARLMLERAGIEGRIEEADMFNPPDDMVGSFDVVVSFGLVEHFTDTTAAHAALARFLRPGGVMVTVVPNMSGSVVGLLQRLLNRPVFDVHELIDRRRLAAANVGAGLDLDWCRYFLAVNLNVVNIASWQNARRRLAVMRFLSGLSKVAWAIERRGVRLPTNRFTSPYIVAVAHARPRSEP